MSKFYEELTTIREHIKEEPKKPSKILWFIDEILIGVPEKILAAIFEGILYAICFVAKAVFGLLLLLIFVAVFLAVIKFFFKVVGFGLGI